VNSARSARADFWRGRRVLVTGHTGFKGGWLALMLHRLGAKVVGFALPPDAPEGVFVAARVAGHIRSITGDVTDLNALRAAVEEAAPEVIVHLAAQALVLPSFEAPVATYATNVLGTAHVLEAARLAKGLRSVLVVTSDKVYENREWLWGYREEDTLGGRDPYSSSKACAELITRAYRDSFLGPAGVRVATARAGNVIGGGDWAKNRIVPDFVRATRDGQPLLVRNPQSTRPWQHVLEPLEGYLLLLERLSGTSDQEAGPWNFGPLPDAVQPVSQLVQDLVSCWGADASWHHEELAQPHEASLLTLDATKARVRLRWRSPLSYASGVRWTVDWYKAQASGSDMEEFTLGQIDRFLEGRR
jgi:CDP-glucose 4,6-dehydratase